jgi:hypothetical protein
VLEPCFAAEVQDLFEQSLHSLYINKTIQFFWIFLGLEAVVFWK